MERAEEQVERGSGGAFFDLNEEVCLMHVRFDLVDSVEGFRALRFEWNALLRESANDNVFLTWEWVSTWWDCFGRDGRPWVLTARSSITGNLVGLAPLVLHGVPRKLGLYRKLGFMGAGHASGDHLDFVIRKGWERQVLDGFLRRFKPRSWDLGLFEGISESSATVPELINATAASADGISRTICPYVRLPSTWKKYVASLPRKVRHNLRSGTRRLFSIANGKIAYRTLDDENDLDGALSTLFELKRQVDHDGSDRSRSDSRAVAEFHRRIARVFLRKGWLRLHLLYFGERPIAMSYCFLYRGKLSFVQTGFDRRWARGGPGTAIVAYSIRQAIRERATEIDFLRGDEPYKFQWTSDARHVVSVRVAHSAWGRVSLSTSRLARGLIGRVVGRSSPPRQVAAPYCIERNPC